MTASADDFDFFGAAARPEAAGTVTPSVAPNRGGMAPRASLQPTGPTPKPSRFAKSDTTFGPFGRVVATIAMIVPLLFFIATGILTFDPFVLVGAAIWCGLMWVGLRQIWQPVHHHHRR
jgi:hypothetical protein